jgi:hypothetical protein
VFDRAVCILAGAIKHDPVPIGTKLQLLIEFAAEDTECREFIASNDFSKEDFITVNFRSHNCLFHRDDFMILIICMNCQSRVELLEYFLTFDVNDMSDTECLRMKYLPKICIADGANIEYIRSIIERTLKAEIDDPVFDGIMATPEYSNTKLSKLQRRSLVEFFHISRCGRIPDMIHNQMLYEEAKHRSLTIEDFNGISINYGLLMRKIEILKGMWWNIETKHFCDR